LRGFNVAASFSSQGSSSKAALWSISASILEELDWDSKLDFKAGEERKGTVDSLVPVYNSSVNSHAAEVRKPEQWNSKRFTC
jgi:hypothetical protein